MITTTEIQNFKSFTKYSNLRCPYDGSPFQLYKNMSSKRKGAAFEQIFEEYMVKQGFANLKCQGTDYDRKFLINGNEVKIEIKGSMLWGEKGDYMRFQQIRTNQDYDVVVFLCIFPHGIEMYFADKDEVKAYVEVQNEKGEWIRNQHGGKRVNSGTFIIDGLPKDIEIFRPLSELIG